MRLGRADLNSCSRQVVSVPRALWPSPLNARNLDSASLRCPLIVDTLISGMKNAIAKVALTTQRQFGDIECNTKLSIGTCIQNIQRLQDGSASGSTPRPLTLLASHSHSSSQQGRPIASLPRSISFEDGSRTSTPDTLPWSVSDNVKSGDSSPPSSSLQMLPSSHIDRSALTPRGDTQPSPSTMTSAQLPTYDSIFPPNSPSVEETGPEIIASPPRKKSRLKPQSQRFVRRSIRKPAAPPPFEKPPLESHPSHPDPIFPRFKNLKDHSEYECE